LLQRSSLLALAQRLAFTSGVYVASGACRLVHERCAARCEQEDAELAVARELIEHTVSHYDIVQRATNSFEEF